LVTGETAYPDGVVSAFVRNQYDEKGQILKEEQFNGTKVLVTQKVYLYPAAGKVEVLTLNGIGETQGKAVREVVEDRILKESLFNPKGELQSTEEYTYDSKGQKTKWFVRTSSGNQVSSEYIWENGNIARVNVLDASSVLIKRFERSYGSEGLLSGEEEYDASGTLLGKIVYVREGKDLVRQENQNPAGGVQSSFKYKNDGDGNPVEIRYLDRNGNLLEVKTQVWQGFTRTVQVQ